MHKHMQSLEDCSHDFAHVQRVRDNALKIASKMSSDVNLLVVELAALCHDIGDAKYQQSITARHLLLECGYPSEMADRVQEIVDKVSFRKELKDIESHGYEHVMRNTCIELAIVQDADRLDAIGAIGISRCFAFSGKRNLTLCNACDFTSNVNGVTWEKYSMGNSTAISHFYEKLLTLKDKIKTEAGRAEAEKRHHFLLEYLNEYSSELFDPFDSISQLVYHSWICPSQPLNSLSPMHS